MGTIITTFKMVGVSANPDTPWRIANHVNATDFDTYTSNLKLGGWRHVANWPHIGTELYVHAEATIAISVTDNVYRTLIKSINRGAELDWQSIRPAAKHVQTYVNAGWDVVGTHVDVWGTRFVRLTCGGSTTEIYDLTASV